MAENDIAISVDSVSKFFKLPHESNNSIKARFTNSIRKKNKGYEVQHALQGISFDIKKGEFFGIAGRNGSGKSTLLKILAGIYQPTKGTVRADGKLVPFIELGVGFNPELSGRENVYLNGALLGFNRKEIDAMYDEIVEFAELAKFMDQKLKNYSSGMQVRLAFSVATRAKADIMLIDEVLAVGDADFQRKCYDYFKALKKTDMTIVFVTHDMSAVREYCDRAILIEGGHITHEGKASTIADEYLKLFMDKGSALVINEANRWGSGEVTFSDISHKVTQSDITISFTLNNNTDKTFDETIDFGLDFYSEDKLITGTHYNQSHTKGLSLSSKQKKKVISVFPNTLGMKNYSINMNIKTDKGLVVCEEFTSAVNFYNTHGKSTFFPVVTDADFKIE
ncbi:MAG: tagH [Candidatus Saccharibacteria bacterium]|nr:tagH [Candidatus Saccharibacteria bacterium]